MANKTIDQLPAVSSEADADELAVWQGGVSKKLTLLQLISYFAAKTGIWPGATLLLSPITNSLVADVLLNNTANFFDGPSVAQGTSGIWYASGTVTVLDTTAGGIFQAKLWDGTTVIATSGVLTPQASNQASISLSGFLSSPAGNLRISVKDINSANGKILSNIAGTKDSTITAIRIG